MMDWRIRDKGVYIDIFHVRNYWVTVLRFSECTRYSKCGQIRAVGRRNL
jgi:hypothetical protein